MNEPSKNPDTELDELTIVLEKLEMSAFKNSGEYTVRQAKQAIDRIANKRALEAQVEEIEHWLRMVAWPNDYQTMKKSMKERIAELQSLINPTELEPESEAV